MNGDPFLELARVAPLLVGGILLFAFFIFGAAMQPRYEEEEKRKRLVVIDDDELVRRGLKTLIETHTEFKVVGEAHTGAEGIRVVGACEPDVVVIDVKLAEMDGIETARKIKSLDPNIEIVGFSSPDDDATGYIMKRAGATACLVKGDDPQKIVTTISQLA